MISFDSNTGKLIIKGKGIDLYQEWITLTSKIHECMVLDTMDKLNSNDYENAEGAANILLVSGLFEAVSKSLETLHDLGDSNDDGYDQFVQELSEYLNARYAQSEDDEKDEDGSDDESYFRDEQDDNY